MTIEQKALELDLIARVIAAYHTTRLAGTDANAHILGKPHVREAFDRLAELDKSRHAAEMREQAERFSEAACGVCSTWGNSPIGINGTIFTVLSPFILAPVDPLAEVIGMIRTSGCQTDDERAETLRAALEARGLAIVKKEAV